MDDDLGTAAADVQADQDATDATQATDAAADTTAAAAGATDTAAQSTPESFINPADLPAEIKPHWSRMHRAYTKKLEELAAHRADMDMLRNFRSNDGYALELLRVEAQRRGLKLEPSGSTTPATAPTPAPARAGDGPPAHLVEAVRARLDPSLHWMAEGQAAAAWDAARLATQPLVEQTKAREKATRDAEYNALAGKLTEAAPGWERHEDDMNALLDWLTRGPNTHPQWGDKLTFLYNAVTNGSASKVAAIRAMGDAARNAVRTGQPGRAAVPNIADRVRKATSTSEAMRIAAEEAERELRANGVPVPD